MAEKNEPSIETGSSVDKQQAEGIESSTALTQAWEQIDLGKIKLVLPPELREADFQELEDALPKATSFSVLVSGRAGTGKSCLVNGILGKPIAEEGNKLRRDGKTRKLEPYQRIIDCVNVTVWDSPGLQDGSDNQIQAGYIMEMREKCSTVDLMLYCIRMFEKRFPRGRSDNPDINAMARITDAFGPEFWRKTVVVLTFANVVESVNVDWEQLDAAAKIVEFHKELKAWREVIQDVLVNEINVPVEIAQSVVVVPAGHTRKRILPDRDYWLSTLWFHCLEVIGTTESRVALVRMNALRIKHKNKTTEKDFELSLTDQPLVVEGFFPTVYDNKGKIIAVTTSVAGIGATLGAIGGAGFGAAIGAPVGFVVGLILALVVAWKKRKAAKT